MLTSYPSIPCSQVRLKWLTGRLKGYGNIPTKAGLNTVYGGRYHGDIVEVQTYDNQRDEGSV